MQSSEFTEIKKFQQQRKRNEMLLSVRRVVTDKGYDTRLKSLLYQQVWITSRPASVGSEFL